MTSTASGARQLTVQINEQAVGARPGETILQTAARSGIEIPNSCRVGACGTCKCRVVKGKVRELTETGYLLTADEMARGTILACQSVPRTDVSIEVEQTARGARRNVRGRVAAQERVAHDITRLTVELEEPLAYRPGQHASLALDGHAGVSRTYSFATPASGDGRVVFYVRKVPGGQLSAVINDEALVGRGVEVEGPSGDFCLRPGESSLLLAAGGSGLAPILAILREALAAGCTRSVTLVFGAREPGDLYALGEIDELARAWRGSFRFVPVLSGAGLGSAWLGERGLATEKLAGLLEPGAQVYLCGPPSMVDSALAVVKAQGVPRERIHFDCHTTRADALGDRGAAAGDGAPDVRDAGVLDYAKYFFFHAIGLYAIVATVLGLAGSATLATFGMLVLILLGDALGGDDATSPRYKRPRVLTAQLWLALPLLALIVFTMVWATCPGDPFGYGALLSRLVGREVLPGRHTASLATILSSWLATGLLIGLIGTITAHELTHRTWDRVSMLIGRWLLAFSFDTSFAIEHVYGHHRYVGTSEDPATAPRGRSVYVQIVTATVRGNLSAWRIEAGRLMKKRLPVLSWHNAFLRGQVMSAALLGVAFGMGGWKAAGFFTACALWGKALLEIVNYMEHYGVVRDPAMPVQPRHSWNTNKRVSSWTMFNLTRHSHHHAEGEVPYHQLKPYPAAPMMLNGYLATIALALVPPLWQALMTPKLLAWDREHASPAERALAAQANARSGIRGLEASVPSARG